MLADSELSIRAHQSCQLACHFKAKTFTSFYHDGRPSPKSCNETTRHPAQPGCCVVLSLLMAQFNLAQLYFTSTYIKTIKSSFSSGSWRTRTTLKANQKNTLSNQIMTQFSTAMKSSWEKCDCRIPCYCAKFSSNIVTTKLLYLILFPDTFHNENLNNSY